MRGKKKEEMLFDHTGQVSVEDMQDAREPCDVPYAPPPNEAAKWKALAAIGAMPKWNGTMKGVMTCLVQCANYYSGKCCPSEEWIAEKLECTDRAVRMAVNSMETRFPHFLEVYHRSEPGRSQWKANGYVIGWAALINRCHAAFPWTVTCPARVDDASIRRKELSTTEEQTFLARRKEPSCELIEEKLIERTYRPKGAHPPSAADAYDSFSGNHFEGVTQLHSGRGERSKGFQEEPTGFSSRDWWIDRLVEAEAALEETSDPEQRQELEAKIARYRAHVEEMPYEQRPKVGASRG